MWFCRCLVSVLGGYVMFVWLLIMLKVLCKCLSILGNIVWVIRILGFICLIYVWLVEEDEGY